MSDDAEGIASRGLPPRMSAPTVADVMAVERIVKLASEGRLRIPSFQRPLLWDQSDRIALLDSIYRGYPVGTVLLWKNPPNGTEAGRPLAPDAPAAKAGDQYLVIDGQQRLSALWDTLGRKPRTGERALVFDMAGDVFRARPLRASEVDGTPPMLDGDQLPEVPLHVVVDAASLSEWVPQELSRESKRRYFELGARIREYKLGTYIVEDADIDVLRRIFDRVNTSGKSMTRDAVFDALLGSRIAEDGKSGLALVNDRLADLEFGAIQSSTILKALEAIRGDRVGRLDPRGLDVSEVEVDLLRTATALRAAVSFLRGVAHVPHIEVCPYELPLVVLARFFARYERPSERNQVLLRRWFWRASLGERLGGASGRCNSTSTTLMGTRTAPSMRCLSGRAPRRTSTSTGRRQDPFSLASARGKMLVCALLDQDPRNLETGERIDRQQIFQAGTSSLFRNIVGENGKGSRHGLANRIIHPTTKQKPTPLILSCMDEASLLSHGIDSAAQAALRKGDVDAFMEHRIAIYKRWIPSFFDRQTELQRDDIPSLAALTRQPA